MEVTTNVGQQPYPMETGKKISKIDVVIMRRGTLGDTQYHNTVRKNGKYCMENHPNTNTTYFNHIYNWFHILMAASI